MCLDDWCQTQFHRGGGQTQNQQNTPGTKYPRYKIPQVKQQTVEFCSPNGAASKVFHLENDLSERISNGLQIDVVK